MRPNQTTLWPIAAAVTVAFADPVGILLAASGAPAQPGGGEGGEQRESDTVGRQRRGQALGHGETIRRLGATHARKHARPARHEGPPTGPNALLAGGHTSLRRPGSAAGAGG